MTEKVIAEIIEPNELAMQVVFTPAEIKFDFDALKSVIARMVEPYMMDDETIEKLDLKEAKACRADLRKLSKSLNDKRKEVKKAYNTPLQAFESSVKEIDDLINAPCAKIDSIVKQREQQSKERRREHLLDCYADFAPALVEVVPFDKVLDPKWLNASFGEVKAENALMDKVTNLANDWEQLKTLKDTLPFYDEAEKELFRTLSLNDAIARNKELAEEQKRMDAMKAQIEEVQEYQQSEPEYEQVPVEVYEQAPTEMPTPEPSATYLLEVQATQSQLDQITAYCKQIGVHGRILATKAVA